MEREHDSLLQSIGVSISDLCHHVSVRRDESGSYLFAIGTTDVYSLEARQHGDRFDLDLWQGRTAEEETIVQKLRSLAMTEAVERARVWLQQDVNSVAV